MPKRNSQGLTEKQRFWLSHLKACEESGQSKVSYAAAHGLKPKYLYNWKTRLILAGYLPNASSSPAATSHSAVPDPLPKSAGNKPTGLSFAAVRISGEGTANAGIRIHFPNGILLELDSSAQSSPSQQLLSHLSALP